MRRVLFLFGCLSVILLAAFATISAQRGTTIPVVLISIDGLKPDYVLEADKRNLKIPNLRRFIKEGAYATNVTGVEPTVTYPSHTTMVTGVSPAKHGIYNNTPFDPFGKNQGGWYWYSEDVKVTTLWDAVNKAGGVTASVDWPVTVGANITHNIAQMWRAGNAGRSKIDPGRLDSGVVGGGRARSRRLPRWIRLQRRGGQTARGVQRLHSRK